MYEYFRYNQNIVVTTYGHGRIVDKISISLFDCINDGDQNIDNYCTTINNLELKDNKWIYAKLVSQNTPYFLHAFVPLQFNDIVEKLDDQALENIIREVDSPVLARALKNENEPIQLRIFSRMIKRSSSLSEKRY